MGLIWVQQIEETAVKERDGRGTHNINKGCPKKLFRDNPLYITRLFYSI